MSFARSLPLLVLCSLLTGAALCGLAWRGGIAGFRGGYAVLTADAAVPDRTLRELLAPLEGDFADLPVSESSQWALLNEFGSLTRIPLDEYPARVTPFDPRNDGYAEKARSFFVRDGKRFVFIPLMSVERAERTLEDKIAIALGAIPFSVEYLGFGKPLGFYVLLFTAAVSLFLFLLGWRKWRHAEWALPCLPVLAVFASDGAPGFALAALLLGLSVLLRDPLTELCGPLRRRSGALSFFKAQWLLSPLFLICYTLVVLYSGFSPLLALGIFAVYTGIYLFSVRTFSLPRTENHILFAPVLIARPSLAAGFSNAGKAALPMLPFALAGLLAALLAVRAATVRSDRAAAAFTASPLITEADYRSHAALQASFLLRPLGREAAGDWGGPYPAYELEPDGLVSPVYRTATVPSADTQEESPFPLKQLMDFLSTGEMKGGILAAMDGGSILNSGAGDLALALVPLLFIIPGILPRFHLF
ncbi:MAG: hypothetical protein LBG57_11975 [Treponema sp.]|jgi:hypothetical protein|nr:hypothetical protein [Treponema sp.]